ncbi:beta-glucuronidase [Chitinophaga costaii]|uniref:Beta-glucuronidase n=1 Tax=Chitinophaga costaii TaxID=1335309 RepID=A0A1C4D2J6_9BACT|nr:glycoside hydrolase family 2 TIM barrel-domain containing protein [Chitinophaga costaii]SCC25674.1 beta-glucuronidase [Chitinophaga costaii]
MQRKKLYHFYLLTGLLWLLSMSATQAADTLQLPKQNWLFAIDPLRVGEAQQWYHTDFKSQDWDKVNLPHCFSTDPRYFFYTGAAWYRQQLDLQDVPANRRLFLHFGAVFYKCKVYLNDQLVGGHEGGYTPFEVELTAKLNAGKNVVAIWVDNSWDTTTIPGARRGVEVDDPIANQVVPWINYGGITRECWLLSRPAQFIQRVKIEATPDLAKGSARLTVHALLSEDSHLPLQYTIIDPQGKTIRCKWTNANGYTLTSLPAAAVKLWDQDHPFLYHLQCIAGTDTLVQSFAIRKVEVKGTRFLLNGHPIKMGGANRPLDYPGLGSMEPDSVIAKDMGLMKAAGMEFSRFCHYPVSENTLNWMDEHGMLIIEEAGNWQLAPAQMADPAIRKTYAQQLREMITRDWNHPCIIAWSVGNEFHSYRPEGIQWVKDMKAFAQALDSPRLVTFASRFVSSPRLVNKPEDEASNYVDFISANIYGNYAAQLEHVHAIYPNKPVFVSEFGIRTDKVKSEAHRIAHVKEAMEAFRQADYVIGACLWTFNDYLSRFPGTDANGYRPWGAVDPNRNKRGLYDYLQEAFAPLVITQAGWKQQALVVQVSARNDFPLYPTEGYKLQYNGSEVTIPALQPGEQATVTLPATASPQALLTLIRPGGFVIHSEKIQ